MEIETPPGPMIPGQFFFRRLRDDALSEEENEDEVAADAEAIESVAMEGAEGTSGERWECELLPSGKLLHNYGKSPFVMGKATN